MKNTKSKLLLIIGCQRSGTTLLAAMLGGHSEINMLFESTSRDVLKLIGKEFSGNKLLAWRQIRKHQRGSKFGHLMNAIVNFDFVRTRKHNRIRLYPMSTMSIQDYRDHGGAIIVITRNKEEVIHSMTSRMHMTRAQAEREYDRAMHEMESVRDVAIHIDYFDLVHKPVETLTMLCTSIGLKFEPRMLKGPEYNIVYPQTMLITEKSKKPAG